MPSDDPAIDREVELIWKIWHALRAHPDRGSLDIRVLAALTVAVFNEVS